MPDPRPIIRPGGTKGRYRRTDLRDANFYAKHQADILRAAREGDIIDDNPTWNTDRNIVRQMAQAQEDAPPPPPPSFDANGSSPARPRTGVYRYHRRDLADTAFFDANRDDIMDAIRKGQVGTDD